MIEGISQYRQGRKRSRRVRLTLLLIILAVTTALGVLHQFPVGFRPASVDALCPFGGLEALYSLLSGAPLVAKIAASSFALLIATVVVALLFRRSFCGNICPLGTLQELAEMARRKLRIRRLELPAGFDRIARYLKYLVLVAVVALSAYFGELVIRPYDPWVAYQHLASAELLTALAAGLVVLVVTLVGSFFSDRFFCKYACPMGAFLGLLGKVGATRIRRDANLCTSCHACDRACPMNLTISTASTVTSAECIACNQCVNSCPVPGALSPEVGLPAGRKARKLRPMTVTLATAALFAAVVVGATLLGQFGWTAPTVLEAAAASAFDAAMIKGSDTFADVSLASGLPLQAFADRFGLSEEQLRGAIKEAAHASNGGFDTEAVRLFVAESGAPAAGGAPAEGAPRVGAGEGADHS
ncbi:MAG TPA: 4Fe-4S binding protein [Spirochaetia bacterium]|nr:4Fe-4S binding protein [Spirochaetia bacterium]